MPAFQPTALQSTTQHYLEIYDVTNDLMILRDGSVAMVITTSSLNFGLLSEEEQDAIIYTYAGLLNSLTFPIEIVIRSQRKDISAYLGYVQELEQKQTFPLRKTQIRRYREFIEELVKERNILDKKFYVVIPYTATSMAATSIVPSVKKKQDYVLDKAYILEKAKVDLEPKRDHLIAQFGRIGLGARQLTTQEIIHLLYTIYNPGSSEGQRMTDTGSYTTPLVEASLQGVSVQPALQSFTKDAATSSPVSIAPTSSAESLVQTSPQQTIREEIPSLTTSALPQPQPAPTMVPTQ